MSQGHRRLAVVMFTDMVGYTALGQRNETLSLALAEEQRKFVRPVLKRHRGKEIKTMGDAFLVEFSNALDSVRCAYDVQRASREFNISQPPEQRVKLRIGLHLGDVWESQGDISGDAVNVASRVQSLAEEGGVSMTRQVYDQVHNKFELELKSLGSKTLKNISAPVELYKMVLPWEAEKGSGALELDAKRVAVLPFANMSPDPNDSYFADGITEEIISTLSGVSGLSVISRTSVMGYKGSTKKAREIGSELEAGSILEGSFRKAGNKVRVTTQLIAVNNDRHVWAQSYDRNLDDVFAVQSDIAKQVSEALRVRILDQEMDRIEKKPTENTKAYSLYLKGRYHLNKRSEPDILKAAEYFRQSVNEDEKFALGYAGLADCSELLAFNWQRDVKANHRNAEVMIEKALEIDPGLGEAYAADGLVLMHSLILPDAEEAFKRAIELKPSYASAHQWYSHLLSAQLRWEEAQREIERAVELDPLSQIISLNHAEFYDRKRDYAKAIELAVKTVEMDPSFATARMQLAGLYLHEGMIEKGKREAKAAVDLLSPQYPNVATGMETMIAYFEKDKAKVRSLIPELEAHVGQSLGPGRMEIAGLYMFLGELDKGFEMLEKAYARKEPNLIYLTNNDIFDPVQKDPRFLDLLKRLELTPPQ